MTGTRRPGLRGFSLIELTIVIIILGVISAIAIPRMIKGAENADVTALTADLAVLRGAMEMCRYEHAAYPSTAIEFKDWLTTTVLGNGPYVVKVPELKTGLQKGNRAAKIIVSDPAVAADIDAGAIGWLFNATTGGIWANDIDHLDK